MFHVPCLEALALCKVGYTATEVQGPPSFRTCPAVRHPQPGPGRRVREASSPPTYYAWMQTGRAYSVFPSGRSRLQAGPRRRLPAPRGCPGRLGNRATRPGTLRARLRKHCWNLRVSPRASLLKIVESSAERRETALAQSVWERAPNSDWLRSPAGSGGGSRPSPG